MRTISTRAAATPPSAVRKLVPLVDVAKSRGATVYHLNIGQPDVPTPPEILQTIHDFPHKTLAYAPSQGLSETIAAWERYFQHKNYPFTRDEIVVTNGASEGLQFAFFTVADPGDELLVIEPFYTSYASSAAIGCIQLKGVTTSPAHGYRLPTKEDFKKRIGPRTKGLVINNPNNPTGIRYTDEEVRRVCEIVCEHDLFLISDETYQELVFDGARVLPSISLPQMDQRVIVCDSVSKRFSSCGARIGCLASKNKEVINAVTRFAQARLSVATLEQIAVIPLLENGSEYTEKIAKTYERRRDVLCEELSKIPHLNFVKPEGAFYIMVTLPVEDAEDFARYLLTDFEDSKETVMIAPGSGFYIDSARGRSEARLAYVLEERKLRRAAQLLGLALNAYMLRKKV
jgi:aspartate aminotransferase